MTSNIFIDGEHGTTGLQIKERLAGRKDITLCSLAEEDRKNPAKKKELLSEMDLAILCLPDQAAKETWELAKDLDCKLIDASTAHRVHDQWTYGLPELEPGQRERIHEAKWVSNPGCYPTGFLLLLAPLLRLGLLPKDANISTHAISGYSGGGKNLIAQYEAKSPGREGWNIRPYGLNLQHKHVPEMRKYSGLDELPNFSPMVGNFPQGMLVQVPLNQSQLAAGKKLGEIIEIWQESYQDEGMIRLLGLNPIDQLEEGFLPPDSLAGSNLAELMAWGHEEQLLLTARLDNLGKGASGACVQNMNLMLGFEEKRGLL